jgi:hypothetical protein
MQNKTFELLREIEFIFEKAITPQSLRADVLMREKTKGRKSRDFFPLIRALGRII